MFDMSNNVPLFVIGLPKDEDELCRIGELLKHENKRQRESIRKRGAN